MIAEAGLTLLILLAAVLYSSVGLGGSTGFIAAMALFDLAPLEMRQSALALNLLVSGLAAAQFLRAGLLDWQLLRPLVVTSIPAAFIGGLVPISAAIYRPVVSSILLFSACWLALGANRVRDEKEFTVRLPLLQELAIGLGIGLLSGLTGVGGAIFLSPTLLALSFATTRRVAAVASAFAFVNSVAGLAGNAFSSIVVTSRIIPWFVAAAVGALIGTHLATQRLPIRAMRYFLSAVLFIAALRFVAG
jgi:uncharacterized protein